MIKSLRQDLENLPYFFRSAKTVSDCGNSLKVNFDRARCLFGHFCVSKVMTIVHGHKSGVIFETKKNV